MKKKLKTAKSSGKIPVVFFGSGPVAAKSLELLQYNFNVVAVVTKPRPPHHRGRFPVIDLAETNDLPLHQVSSKQDLSSLIKTKPFDTDLAILIDFGIIVTRDVIDYFPKGIVNSHFSLLPQWRGADPITFAILSGQEETGVSLMLIDEGMDTGRLLRQVAYTIKDDETTPSLTDALIKVSDQSLKETMPLWVSNDITAIPQEASTISPVKQPTYSRKLSKDDGVIDWHKSAEQIEREIRAFIGWPGSRTNIFGKDVIITKARSVSGEAPQPGKVSIIDKSILSVQTSQGLLHINRLKPAGKKEMAAKDFIAGYSRNYN